MEDLGVDINMSKSLRSNIGVGEFAKRLITPSMEVTPLGPGNIVAGIRNWVNTPNLLLDLVLKGKSFTVSAILKKLDSLPS